MLSSKTTNKPAIELHKGKPHIRTEIVILSPISEHDGFADELRLRVDLIERVMKSMNENIEDVIGEAFASDIESIYSTVRNLGTKQQSTVKAGTTDDNTII